MAHSLKTKTECKSLKNSLDSRYIYRNELDKACFQHDMAYGNFKDLARRTAADKVLRDKTFNIAKDPKFDGYQRGMASMVYKFFDKMAIGSGIKNEIKENQKLANELHKPIIKKIQKKKKSVFSIYRQYLGC